MQRILSVTSRAVASIAAFGALLLPTASLQARQTQGDAAPKPFECLWGGASGPSSSGEPWQDWAAQIQFGDVAVRRDIKVMYQSECGLYPYAGIHQVEMDPDWMRRHFLKIQAGIDRCIPDVNQSGYGAIDYEEWAPAWSILYNLPSNQGPNARDMDYKDDWRDYIRQRRPELLVGRNAQQQESVFENTYNDAARRFMLATLRECKRLRPNMKWGYYCFPPRSYHDMQTPEGRAAWAAKHRTQLQWLYQEQEVFYPDIYSLYYTVEGRNPDYTIQEDAVQEFREYIRWNIVQAVELAQGKPVLAFIWFRYHENARHYAHQYLNDINLLQTLELAKQYGADGVVIWDAITSTAQKDELQNYVNTKALSAIRSFCTDASGASFAPSTSSPPTEPGTPQNSMIGDGSQQPPSSGNPDPLNTRPYVAVRPGEATNAPGPSTNPSNSGSGAQGSGSGSSSADSGQGQPAQRSYWSRYGRSVSIFVPRNVRTRSNGSRNPAMPAAVQPRGRRNTDN